MMMKKLLYLSLAIIVLLTGFSIERCYKVAELNEWDEATSEAMKIQVKMLNEKDEKLKKQNDFYNSQERVLVLQGLISKIYESKVACELDIERLVLKSKVNPLGLRCIKPFKGMKTHKKTWSPDTMIDRLPKKKVK